MAGSRTGPGKGFGTPSPELMARLVTRHVIKARCAAGSQKCSKTPRRVELCEGCAEAVWHSRKSKSAAKE